MAKPAVAFTVRMPEELEAQIQQRIQFTRRSRNAEIIYLVERALDHTNEQNDQAARAAERNRPPD